MKGNGKAFNPADSGDNKITAATRSFNPNQGAGWITTTDPGGNTIHHYVGGGGGVADGVSNSHDLWGGVGLHLPDPNDILQQLPETQAMMVAGMPMVLGTVRGGWGATLSTSRPLSAIVDEALSQLGMLTEEALPYAGRLAGALVGMLIPAPLGSNDMVSVVDMLPANVFTKETISTQPSVTTQWQIQDVIADGKQQLAVVRPDPARSQVKVVQAVATQRPGVFTVNLVPGKPAFTLKIDASPASSVRVSSSKYASSSTSTQVGLVQAVPGEQTQHAIITFPAANNIPPVYIAVAPLLR